jgi:hypothetical protein
MRARLFLEAERMRTGYFFKAKLMSVGLFSKIEPIKAEFSP